MQDPAPYYFAGSDPLRLEIEQNYLSSFAASEKAPHILFTNLLRNAFSYTREGTISSIIDENRVTVSDTGIGTEQGQLQQVFEPFYRAQNDNRGHGLGLTIVNRLCNRFGGQLKISSKPGEGSRVLVGLFSQNQTGGRKAFVNPVGCGEARTASYLTILTHS